VKDEDKSTAHTTFQRIALAYAVLSSPQRRARYDATGQTSESLYPSDGPDDFDWLSFYRGQYDNSVNEASINKVRDEYVGGEEERGDVLKAYTSCKGNMKKLYESVMFSEPWVDEERFRGMIDSAIEEEEVQNYKQYKDETEAQRKTRIDKARKWAEREAAELEEETKKREKDGAKKQGKAAKKTGGMDELAALIQQRQKARAGGFFEHLEEKFAPRGKKRVSEPPEEAFAKGREGMGSERGRKKAKRVVEDDERDTEEDMPKKKAVAAGKRSGRKKG
jgi:DnaJ family protein C protein 9